MREYDQEYLALSWLAQLSYCPRRVGLLMNERAWEESADTAKGRAEHERVHTQRVERRGDRAKLYEYTVYSDTLHILGKCDCIEAVRAEDGCWIPALQFPVQLYPIEYKHGSLREEESYQIQLCAQAMCLEEMFHTTIREGALFFHNSHRRLPVSLDEALRVQVRQTVEELHRMREKFLVPAAQYSAKCKRCSMKEVCMPKTKRSASTYCQALRSEAEGDVKGEDML